MSEGRAARAGGAPTGPGEEAGTPGSAIIGPGSESAAGAAGQPPAEVAGREGRVAHPGEEGASARKGATTPGAGEIGVERAAPGQTAESPAGRGERVEAPLQPGPSVAGARPEITEFKPTPTLGDVFFDFDAYDIRPEDARILDANIDWLRSHADHLVLIEGHCDERGTNGYNIALGDHRARATRNYLVAHGIAEARIATFSYGEERPFCIERAEECWAQNRRAHFLVKAR
jgi:peptidoglycan-associated lipoprotein